MVAAWQYQSAYQLGAANTMITKIREPPDLGHVHLGGAIVTGYDDGKATHRTIVNGLRDALTGSVWGVVPWRVDIERAIHQHRPLTAMPLRINPVPKVYSTIAETALTKLPKGT